MMGSFGYASKTISQTYHALNSSPSGLPEKEIVMRQKEQGFNEVVVKHSHVFPILLRQVKSPFFYLLLAAALLSLFWGDKINVIMLVVFVALNVLIGFLQEFRAEHSLAMLQKLVPQKALVMRHGKAVVVNKRELVVGDVVLLAAGDIIPADVRLVDAQNLLIDESALTGESVSLVKTIEPLKHEPREMYGASNLAFSGTLVVGGRGKGIVVAIAKDTQLGSVVDVMAKENHQSAYEKDLMYFCKLILRIVLVTIVLIFLINLVLKGSENIVSFLLFCVALIISILPEALPAVVALALSRGSFMMAKENVVVKRLSAIEDLGNVEVLCTDKTGTLTENKLSLEKVISSDRDKALLYALIGVDETRKQRTNSFQAAFLQRAGHRVIDSAKKYSVVSELAFDSFRMAESRLVKNKKGESVLIMKGSPEAVLKACQKFPHGFDRKEIREDIMREGQVGKRAICIAYKKHDGSALKKSDEKGLTFLGYFVFEDPLKSSAGEAIRLAKKLGVQIKIITGDSPEVAGYVAQKVGLLAAPEMMVTGVELENMAKEDFDDACRQSTVFARISPAVKQKIIASLQKEYEVGFLGEGINDAPALKTADVGVAVVEASDIAKEAADVVLLKKDLRVIVDGIKNGRTIFSNINKYVKGALASNFGNFYSIAIVSLFVNFLPLLPVQILLGNLLSDFPAISIAGDSVDVEELRRPRMYRLYMVLPLIISLALVSIVFDFIFFAIFRGYEPAVIQTLWFIGSILAEIGLIFIIRTRHVFYKAKRPSLSLWLFAGLTATAVLILPFMATGQKLFYFVAPPLWPLLVVLGITGLYFGASEVVKLVYFKYFKPRKPD